LISINNLITKNPSKRFIATGDLFQLKSFGYTLNNIPDIEDYKKHCINMLFKNQILLKINKRLKTDEDKLLLENLKNDIFDDSKNNTMIKLLKNYDFNIIYKMEDVKTKNNVCFFNYKVDQVNKFVHNKLIDIPKDFIEINGIKYFNGLFIVCKKHMILNDINNKKNRMKFYVNHEYKIDELNNKTITLINTVDNDKITCNLKSLNKKTKKFVNILDNFNLPYANTAHALQGLSIDDEITIFDTDVAHTDPNYVYVALTRARDFKKVNIFVTNKYEKERLHDSKIDLYFKDKINGYKLQDKNAGRKIDKNNFIDLDYIKTQLNYKKLGCCKWCHQKYFIDIKDGNVSSNISFDRLNNSKCHSKDNLQVICSKCNSKKGKYNY
jgi:hypothetical protein